MQKLLELSAASYEHPFDKKALDKVRSLHLLTEITNFIMNWTSIKWRMVELEGSCFHVTKDSCPELYKTVKEIGATLDITNLPQVYTEWSYLINAYATGYKDMTMIVLNSGTVDLMTDSELSFVIGHEMGHIKSDHVIYHQMLWYLSDILANVPLAQTISQPLTVALMYWYRMSEFTADRAGLLACQDIDAAISAITKMAGIPKKYFPTINKDMILEQAKEFEEKYSDFLGQSMRTISVLDNSHPWTVMRAAELIKWVDSGDYERLLKDHAGKICLGCKNPVPIHENECPICGGHKFSQDSE